MTPQAPKAASPRTEVQGFFSPHVAYATVRRILNQQESLVCQRLAAQREGKK